MLLRCLLSAQNYKGYFMKSREVKQELIQFLSLQKCKKQIASAICILPTYLTQQYVNKFWQHQKCEYYINLAIKQSKNKEQNTSYDFPFSLVFHEFTKRIINMQYLEAYLNWLLKDCSSFNLNLNNYFFQYFDISQPEKWFQTKNYCAERTFIYHHGPTNSGKSTSAVSQLKTLLPDQKGIYMAPLRLLAWEYQQKLGNCSLITGQQKDYRNSNLISCTIETLNIFEQYQVAVIDEIQMIGDPERGWAWTKAILGLKAKRIHLCGDQRALGLISRLIQITGDRLQQKRYSRLSKLKLIHKIFDMKDITPGDCIIKFSMQAIFKIRNQINEIKNYAEVDNLQDQKDLLKDNTNAFFKTKKKKKPNLLGKNYTSIVYGRLPSECRRLQARYFNQNKLPFLVATNAIGMGLNLNIKRIIFQSIHRNSREGIIEELEDHEIQQIAGRAGRGKQNGYVQCSSPEILNKVKKALAKVNQRYGINLQNIKDGNNGSQQIITENTKIELSKQNAQYSQKLGRNLSELQSRIKRASLYFPNKYIEAAKLYLEHLVDQKMSIVQTIQFMGKYTKINKSLYFLQRAEISEHQINKLEQYGIDVEDSIIFAHGMSLCRMYNDYNPRMKDILEFARSKMMQNFSNKRKVEISQCIITHYKLNFCKFKYMDQIRQLQLYFTLLETYIWLWNKFQYAFYQIDLARTIKDELVIKITQILEKNQFKYKNKNVQTSKTQVENINQMKAFISDIQDHNNQKQIDQQAKIIQQSQNRDENYQFQIYKKPIIQGESNKQKSAQLKQSQRRS